MVTGLGRESALEIQKISAEQMYINYIFPVFYKFSEDERLKHLKHIRDRLFWKKHTQPGFKILARESGSTQFLE